MRSFWCAIAVAASVGGAHAFSMSEILTCPDGSIGRMIYEEISDDNGALTSLTRIDCSASQLLVGDTASPFERGLLEKRQRSICTESCTQTCYSGSNGPNPDHCDDLAEWMWERQTEWTVRAGERFVLASGTCAYTFTNLGSSSVTWCDDEWAETLQRMAWNCDADRGARGGKCETSTWIEEVIRNDGSIAAIPNTAGPIGGAAAPTPTPPRVTPGTPQTSPQQQPPVTNTPYSQGSNGNNGNQTGPSRSVVMSASVISVTRLATIDGQETTIVEASTTTRPVATFDINLTDEFGTIQTGETDPYNGVPSIPMAVIVGAALGGLALVILIIGLLCFWRRKRQIQSRSPSSKAESTLAPNSLEKSLASPPLMPTITSKLERERRREHERNASFGNSGTENLSSPTYPFSLYARRPLSILTETPLPNPYDTDTARTITPTSPRDATRGTGSVDEHNAAQTQTVNRVNLTYASVDRKTTPGWGSDVSLAQPALQPASPRHMIDVHGAFARGTMNDRTFANPSNDLPQSPPSDEDSRPASPASSYPLGSLMSRFGPLSPSVEWTHPTSHEGAPSPSTYLRPSSTVNRGHSRRPSSTALTTSGYFPAQVQEAAPNMSQQDIDRLAQSIVEKMRGRDPARGGLDDLPPPPFEHR